MRSRNASFLPAVSYQRIRGPHLHSRTTGASSCTLPTALLGQGQRSGDLQPGNPPAKAPESSSAEVSSAEVLTASAAFSIASSIITSQGASVGCEKS